MNVPSFICSQPMEQEANEVYALRMRVEMANGIAGDVPRMRVEVISEPVFHFTKQGCPTDAAIGLMLKFGTYFEKALNTCNVLRAANDIARCTRRGAGNTIVIHEDDANYFNEFWEKASHLDMTIETVKTPQLQGKMIVNYKGRSGQIDGAPIMAIKDDQYGFSLVGIQDYVRILDLDYGPITS